MLREVQAGIFVFDIHAQTDQPVDDLEQDERRDARKGHREQHGLELIGELAGATPSDTVTPLAWNVDAIAGFTSVLARKPSINMPVMLPTA